MDPMMSPDMTNWLRSHRRLSLVTRSRGSLVTLRSIKDVSIDVDSPRLPLLRLNRRNKRNKNKAQDSGDFHRSLLLNHDQLVPDVLGILDTCDNGTTKVSVNCDMRDI